MLRTDYKFWIEKDNSGVQTEMTPLNFGACSFRERREKTWNFFRQEFVGELIFMNADYDYFYTEYQSGSYCHRYDLMIEQKCNYEYDVFWLGYFTLSMGNYNFESCTFTVTPILNDAYSCIVNNIDIKYNIMSTTTKYTLTAVPGELPPFVDAYNLQRAMKLDEVIADILDEFCEDEYNVADIIGGDFFTAAINPVTGVTNRVNHLYIVQASDAN